MHENLDAQHAAEEFVPGRRKIFSVALDGT
jgi:hypothetical protein